MLTHKEEQGILWVSPLFASSCKLVDSEERPIVVTVDDCECIDCDLERGPIDFISTLLLYVPNEESIVIQRLTPAEAEAIGKALIQYSHELRKFKEELNEG
jgi:hypothetical protein